MDPSKTKEEEGEEAEERVPMFSGRPTPMPIPQPMPKPVKTWPTFNVTGFSIDWLKNWLGILDFDASGVNWPQTTHLLYRLQSILSKPEFKVSMTILGFQRGTWEPPFHVLSLSAWAVVDWKRTRGKLLKRPYVLV